MNSNLIGRRGLLKAGGSVLAGAVLGSGLSLPLRAQTPAAKLTRNTDVVRLGYGRGGLTLQARDRGVMEKTLAEKGIRTEWVGPFANHAPSMQAIVGGSADFGFWGSSTPAMAGMLAGSPLVFTSFLAQKPRSTAIIAKKDSGIAGVKDLVGKRVAVNRSGLGEFLLVAALEQNGIARDDVEFVYLNPADAAPAFAQGQVDAWSMWSPAVDIARHENNGADIFNEGRDLKLLIDYSSMVSTRQFTEENSELVRAVLDAYKAEGEWQDQNAAASEEISQREGKYADEVRNHLTGLNRTNHFYEPDDAAFMADLQIAADWLAERKIIRSAITVADYSVKVAEV